MSKISTKHPLPSRNERNLSNAATATATSLRLPTIHAPSIAMYFILRPNISLSLLTLPGVTCVRACQEE